MANRSSVILGFLALATVGGAASSDRLFSAPTGPFVELSLVVEANVNDMDGEVILHAESGQPLKRLALVAPSGKLVQALDATEGLIGLSELRLETGEPTLQEVFNAYPEGTYRVRALTLEGVVCAGEVELTHDLPARWAIRSPVQGAVVPRDQVTVEWSLDASVEHYTVEVEDSDDEQRMLVTPQPGQSSFLIPSSLLREDTDYQVVVVAHNAAGNRVIQEVEFRTAP
ncbi:MAG: fibronectin type III domain-containing protein [Planctomycetota bacterium]